MQIRPTSRRLAVTIVLFAALSACTSEEEKPSSPENQETKALLAIREVFSSRVRGDGTPVEDATVIQATRYGIEWRPRRSENDGPPPALRLLWDDLEDVDVQVEQEKPASPEVIYLYLARGARSIATAQAVRPPLSSLEVVRCYVALRERPRGSRLKLAHALDTLRRLRPKPVRTTVPSEPAPVTSASESALEARLKQLKDLHDKGLIDDEVYKEAQRKALAGE